MAAQRPLVHVRARDLELVADLGRLDEHLLARERVGQAVVDHRVEHLRVAHAVAEAALRQQVGRARHGLHAPGHDRAGEVAGTDVLVREADGAQARRTDLVDRLGRHFLRNSAVDLGLPGGNLALAGLEHLSEDDVLDLVWRDSGALERAADGGAAELDRVDGGEGAAHLAERRAGGTEDDGLGHAGQDSDGPRRAAARLCVRYLSSRTGSTMRPNVLFVTLANDAYQAAAAVAIPIQPPAWTIDSVPLALPMPSTMNVAASNRNTRLTATDTRNDAIHM